MQNNTSILRDKANWKNLYFYQKAQCLYVITFYFAHKYLKIGDRTIDQMIQAARSGKQNIAEGSEDGVTSTKTEINLINVAKASLIELREDYEDYLRVRKLCLWDNSHPRFAKMLSFCKNNNLVEKYEPFLLKMDDESIANMAITLCHITDRLMESYQKYLANQFTKFGGISERMTANRLGYKKQQQEIIGEMKQKIELLQYENQQLKNQNYLLQQQLSKSNTSP